MIWTKNVSGHFCTLHWHHNNAVIHCCLIWTQIRPILLAACHTLDEQVMSGYPRSETSRIKQHLVILSVGIIEDEDEGHTMISLFCTWLDNSSFWGRPYFLLRLACSGTLHWGRQYGWKSGWAEVPTTVIDPSSNFLAYFRPQYHVWSPLESHLNNLCWTIFGLTVAFLAARLGWHSLGLCLQRQVLRNTLHRPGWIDKEGYAGQSVIVRRGIFARRDKTHNVVNVYFAIGVGCFFGRPMSFGMFQTLGNLMNFEPMSDI